MRHQHVYIFLTGRITEPGRADAGKLGSWSWTESNFHPDDQMDLSYTDPNYKPVYSLDGYSADIIASGECIHSAAIVGVHFIYLLICFPSLMSIILLMVHKYNCFFSVFNVYASISHSLLECVLI